MAIKISNSVKIEVRPKFNELQSDIEQNEFFFTYYVHISNLGNETIQLMQRQWDIVDSVGEHKCVKGEGVVGEQPVLLPGDTYEYYSGCLLKTGFGKMSGAYVFKVLQSGALFESEIPEFTLQLPWVLN
ncbi:MAG: Co2+/Mg2+ efflux protein ApaG [Bacteroidota bacterium]|jgi:ApaG protein